MISAADLVQASSDPSTNLGAFAETSFTVLKRLLTTALRPIAEGQAFETTPFDWAGYK